MFLTCTQNRTPGFAASRAAALSLVLLALGARTNAQQATPDPQPPASTPAIQSASPDAQPPVVTPPLQAPAPNVPAPASAPTQPAAVSPALAAANSATDQQPAGGITEDELKQMLVGKTFYLRGGYLDSTISFNENGAAVSRSPQGSYTLSLIEIDRVHLLKHKLEMDGTRYGLHFLGALPYEDPSNAVDKVRITPKKKTVHITIDREVVIKPKKEKPEKPSKGSPAKAQAASGAPAAAQAGTHAPGAAPAEVSAPASAEEPSDADQLKAEIAATPEAERPADPNVVTTTTSPAHATEILKKAIDRVFAPSLDDRMMAAMPDFWKLYYQAAAAKTDFRPTDPAVQRQTTVEQKARLISNFEPESNEWAQEAGVAGMALYHTVIGPDGKPQQIAVGRPIGFGLDENAVAAIRNAKFEPAIKDGKPVPVLIDLVVQFRIFSKRTAADVTSKSSNQTSEQPTLPGPWANQSMPQ